MSTFHLYTAADGETRIVPHETPLAEYSSSRLSPRHHQSEPVPVGKMVFFKFLPGTAGEWHRAPRRQYLILRGGQLEITPSGGPAHTLQPGDAVLIEDTTGKGHLTRTLSPEGATGVMVHLAGEPG